MKEELEKAKEILDYDHLKGAHKTITETAVRYFRHKAVGSDLD